MLKLEQKKNPNARVLVTDEVEVLFSYETPVAFRDAKSGRVYVTKKRHSTTTDRHILDWLAGACVDEAERVPQDFIDDVLNYEAG